MPKRTCSPALSDISCSERPLLISISSALSSNIKINSTAALPSTSSIKTLSEQLLEQQQFLQLKNDKQDDLTANVNDSLCYCVRCNRPICEKYLYKVLEQNYHENCLRCVDCQLLFTNKCFSAHGKIYCREHFLRRFGPKCSTCFEYISERSIVRKANEHIYHVNCFQCLICKNQFATGDQFYLAMDGRLVCQNDFENFANKESEMDCGNKRPRTTISAKSLETLKQAYQASSKPARHIREQLAAQTGLDMRVVQVWFQNRRAKEKRLKKDAGRRWNNNNNNGSVNANGLIFGNRISGGMDGSNRTLDSDSGSNDESLTDRSPLYGGGVYMDTSSDLDMHSELNYDSNYLPDTASVATNCGIVSQVLPPTRTMLAAAAAAGMHSLMHPNSQDQLPNTTPHLHHSEMPSSIYVDINSISAASISTPSTSLTNTACLSTALRSGDSLTPNSQQHILNSNPTTPLIQHALHNNNGNIQNVATSASIQQSSLQSHEQQLAAAATTAAVAAATAAAAHRQQQHQQQLQQLHQIQQQQHHQLMLMQQQHQNHLQMEHHHGLNDPFHHHVLQSAQLVADSIGVFTPQ